MAGLALLSVSLLAVSSTSAYAHRMKAFSWVEGEAIEGEAYFTNGQMAADSTVELLVDQKVVATTQSDEEGQFRFEALAAGDYQIRTDAGQGHVATYYISASEFSVDESDMDIVVEPSGPEASQSQKTVDSTLSKAQVEQAVAKAIRPLREQLDQYEAKVRLHDILGGIGYIFGLFGLFVLYRSRRQ
ncbi:hypothetical protein BIT28_15760 [Photobacterium proteolyticum]|uniref:SD-repeat containing protein B domain-containing protein n=1 Tax=Photobacterium proteolyticum TaxID=1903952 RepID=A0A1Q9GZ07_9GAMM|nr:hypothetical protein BIT28_15760 [Photobacterium proteolyticum]